MSDASGLPVYPDLAGKVAVVTGGSKGIGRECCRLLAHNGAAVAVVARSQSSIDETVAEIEHLGGRAIGSSTDVTDAGSVALLREKVEAELGPADLLVPYAGGFESYTPAWDTSLEEWNKVIDDNLTSTFLTVTEFVGGMIERGHGSIVTMSSVSGRFLDQTVTASYAASKAAVIMYTRHIAIELGPLGVRVNSIAPGTTRSERIDRIMDAEATEETIDLSPLQRMGEPIDCAHATMYLLSEASSWITGLTLDINGGRAML